MNDALKTTPNPAINPAMNSTLNRQTLGDLLRRTAQRDPHKLAIRCGATDWTYREFDDVCNRFASGLASIGVGSGDRVAVLARNSHGFAALRFAVARLGAVLVPINFMLSSGEANFILVMFSIAPVSVTILAILVAANLFKTKNDKPARLAASLGGFYRAAGRKFYVDELYLFITKKIIFPFVGQPVAWIDKNIVDGFMNLLATSTAKISEFIKGIQSGKVQSYALYFFGGIAALAVIFIYLWK